MKFLFKPEESYLIRHKILEYLYIKGNEEINYQEPSKVYTITEVSKAISVPYDKVSLYHEILHDLKDIHCARCCDIENCPHHMRITSEGRQSYIHKKYIKEGSAERIGKIKDYSAIISPVISALSLIVATISLSILFGKSPKEDRVRIQIESKVPELKIKELKETPKKPKIQHQ